LDVPFDRSFIEAKLALKLISPEDMPKLAWDAMEAGMDGPALRRLGAMVKPSWSEVESVLPNARKEMQLTEIKTKDAGCRLARLYAHEILETGKDPLLFMRNFEFLWIRAGYPTELAAYGTLRDEVSVARQMGRSERDIRMWLTKTLEELRAS
jgi:hypothetical protein